MLTPKQERFCLNIFQGMSQREAYIKAGYSDRAKPSTLDERACVLVKTDKIETRLAELQKAAEDESVASVLERKEILSDIARAKLVDFIDVAHDKLCDVAHNKALSEYTAAHNKKGNGKKTIKLHDPVKAISELNKMEGIYNADDREKENNTTYNILILNSVEDQESTKERLKRITEGKR